MTDEQRDHAIRAMLRFGGGFVSSLARAYQNADDENRRRIETTWPEYFEQYSKVPKERLE
jgi:hypothetical protein